MKSLFPSFRKILVNGDQLHFTVREIRRLDFCTQEKCNNETFFLEEFGRTIQNTSDPVCLAHIFTYKDFSNGTQGNNELTWFLKDFLCKTFFTKGFSNFHVIKAVHWLDLTISKNWEKKSVIIKAKKNLENKCTVKFSLKFISFPSQVWNLEYVQPIVHYEGLANRPGVCRLHLNSGKITNLENVGLTTVLNHGVNKKILL